MDEEVLTREDISEKAMRKVGMSKKHSTELVNSLFMHLCHALERGEQVKIARFGTFAVSSQKGHIGRNPKTGRVVDVPPRRVVKFKPSDILRKRVE